VATETQLAAVEVAVLRRRAALEPQVLEAREATELKTPSLVHRSPTRVAAVVEQTWQQAAAASLVLAVVAVVVAAAQARQRQRQPALLPEAQTPAVVVAELEALLQVRQPVNRAVAASSY
jgi:hypothetical protein